MTKKRAVRKTKRFREARKSYKQIDEAIQPYVVPRKLVIETTAGKWDKPSSYGAWGSES